ncbi:MAG: hypothetical protein LC664_02315 [Flavobacteriales bacterium]|nr:hypothetical protein [Flavobacteriales bacterium]
MKNSNKEDRRELTIKLKHIRDVLVQEESPILSELRKIYFDANLEYINCCEKSNNMHYHPSAKLDKRLEMYVESGKTEQARKTVIKRLDELIGSLES